MKFSENPSSLGIKEALALFIFSWQVLFLEVLFTRIFSFVLWHHFGFMAISVALLGFAGAGSWLSVKSRPPELRRTFFYVGIFSSLTVILGFIIISRIPFSVRPNLVLKNAGFVSIAFRSLFLFRAGGFGSNFPGVDSWLTLDFAPHPANEKNPKVKFQPWLVFFRSWLWVFIHRDCFNSEIKSHPRTSFLCDWYSFTCTIGIFWAGELGLGEAWGEVFSYSFIILGWFIADLFNGWRQDFRFNSSSFFSSSGFGCFGLFISFGFFNGDTISDGLKVFCSGRSADTGLVLGG